MTIMTLILERNGEDEERDARLIDSTVRQPTSCAQCTAMPSSTAASLYFVNLSIQFTHHEFPVLYTHHDSCIVLSPLYRTVHDAAVRRNC